MGGITFAEISALRLVNRQLSGRSPRRFLCRTLAWTDLNFAHYSGRNLLIVTTDTVTGSSMLSSLMPEPLRRTAAAGAGSDV